jgi:hypothetical protein
MKTSPQTGASLRHAHPPAPPPSRLMHHVSIRMQSAKEQASTAAAAFADVLSASAAAADGTGTGLGQLGHTSVCNFAHPSQLS